MGEAKRRKMLLEGITPTELMNAFNNWCSFCTKANIRGNACRFEKHIGCEIDFHAVVTWMLPKYAKKVRTLLNPHYYTLVKAHYARKGVRKYV